MKMNLQQIIDQLEKCDYTTKDQLHDLKMNTAFIELKKMAENENSVIEQLRQMSNSYKVENGKYVIYKWELDNFINENY
jgi:predicted DNA binding protein